VSAGLVRVQSPAPAAGALLGALQRKCDCSGESGPQCEECKKKKSLLQRRAPAGAGQGLAPAVVNDVLRSPGQPLDPTTRAFMESRFGHDFGRVRVHIGAKASASALAVDALAYTVGPDVVFRQGQYRPETEEGRKILAHELTHVVQQRAASTSERTGEGSQAKQSASLQAELEVSAPGDRYEREAERISEAIVRTPEPPWPAPANREGSVLRRYKVPSSLACKDVASWLDSNSPYKPEWAQTACDYSFNGDLRVSPPKKVGRRVQVTVKGHKGLSVSVDCFVDRPEWTPSARQHGGAEQAVWIRMRAVLDKHERAHQAIGKKWRPTIERQFQVVNFSVTGDDEADAKEKAVTKVQTEQAKWVGPAQQAQNAIDPFRDAVLRCPPKSTELEEFTPSPHYIGPLIDRPQPVTLQGGEGKKKPAPESAPALSPELEQLFPP